MLTTTELGLYRLCPTWVRALPETLGLSVKRGQKCRPVGFTWGHRGSSGGCPRLKALQALGQAGSSSACSGGNRGLAGCPPRLEDRSVEMGKVHAGMQGWAHSRCKSEQGREAEHSAGEHAGSLGPRAAQRSAPAGFGSSPALPHQGPHAAAPMVRPPRHH